jgi:hypothetical protein
MEKKPDTNIGGDLPGCAAEYIRQVCRRMRYRRHAREDVRAELTAHFEDELRDCASPEEREQRAQQLIEQFGDAKLLAVLCRRAKKRCRPLWRKVLVRTVQAGGVLVVYSALCSARLFIGTPSLKVDYLAWLSDHTRAGHEESLNAKPYLDKAADLLPTDEESTVKIFRIIGPWPGDMNEPERQILADLLDRNTEAFKTLRYAMTRPYYWADYGTKAAEPVAETRLPVNGQGDGLPDPAGVFERALIDSLSRYKRLCQTFRGRILWEAYQGDVSGALDDGLVLMDVGMHMEGRGTETEQLVGIAIDAMGQYTISTLLDRCDVPTSDLVRLQSRLADLYARHESLIDVTASRAAWLALVQRTFTDDGTGNGHVLKDGLPLVADAWTDGVASLLSFSYPDRRETTALIDTFWTQYQLALNTEPSDPQYEQRQARWRALARESYILEQTSWKLGRMVNLVWRMKTGRRALLTTIAVMRYVADKGAYPVRLDALVAEGYLNELPADPYTGRPFHYRRTEDGFLLYGVGKDLKDDKGQQAVGQNGKPRMFADSGDWVFWPPESRRK